MVSALLRENYGGLAGNVITTGDGCEEQFRLRLPGTGRMLPLEPDGYTADLRVPAGTSLTLDDVQVAVATLAGTRDLAGAAAFAAECRRTLDEARLRARHQPRPAGPLCYDALAAARPHPVYPASPCRLGLTDNDLLRYAPEFSPGFELRWAAIPKPLVTRSYDADPAWWPAPGQVGLDPGIGETHDLFPLHPLIIRATPVTVAPRPYLRVHPTLSMRTVAVAGHPDEHLKLPLPASTLGLRNRRDIVPATLADGALAGRMLSGIKAADPGLDALLIADDTRYAHAGHRAAGYLLRRFPPGLDDAQVVPVAALTARASDGRTIFEDLAGPAGIRQFAGEYFRLVLGIAARLLVRHGIALESHQQNAALVVRPGQPLRLLVKDFDGTLVHAGRAPEIPGFADRRMLTDDDEALADVFITITVHLCVGAIAFGLAEGGTVPLADLLGEARRALEEVLEEEADRPAAKLLRVRVLEAGRLPGKSMVTAGTLTAKEHTGAADVNKYYGTTGPNYLAERQLFGMLRMFLADKVRLDLAFPGGHWDTQGVHRTRRITVAAVVLAAVTGLAACSGSGGSSSIGNGSGANATGQKVKGGTVTEAWQSGQNPDFIFPLIPASNTDGYNQNLSMFLWPYLVSAGDGAKSAVNQKNSLFTSMTWSDGDKTVTIKLKPWKWSDGQPITSRDFTFVYNLLKANVPNWVGYTPGLFPDDVKSVQTPDASTVVLNLTRSYNPDFYEDNVLTQIPLLPQHAWDKTSASGKVGDYDQTTSGAKAVYSFLQKQGGDISTFTTNPLWKVVDGPFTLSGYSNDGNEYTYVPNKHYSGTVPAVSKIVNEVFTSDTAELDALRSGGSLTVGQLPQNDLNQAGVLKSEGYSIVNMPLAATSGITPNFYNAKTGPLVRQLYVRQALEDLINRPQIVKKVYGGYADPGNGPVPVQGFSQWLSPLEKSGGPYPYSPAKAIALLKAHGWKVTPNGTTTCADPGAGTTQCGSGIAKGEPLEFQLIYPSGEATTDQMMAAIKSSEEQAGVEINLKSEPYNTLSSTLGTCTAASHPASGCSWQLQGGQYQPYYLYPSGEGEFNTGGVYNSGGYSNPTEDKLINETEYGDNPQVFEQYENYTAEQLPWLWTPLNSIINVYKSNLGGYAPLNPFSGAINDQDWYFTK